MVPLRRPSSLPAPRGFTLIEAVMAIAISVIVLGTLESLILVAAKATPNDNSLNTVSVKASANLDYLASDLQCATAINALSTTAVELQLPDRDGDGDSDIVRYDWSGVSGDPMYRKYTGSDSDAFDTSCVVIPALTSLSFIPDVKTVITTTPAIPAGATTTTEGTLDSYTSTSSISAYSLSTNAGLGQVIVPALPANATSYRVTRIGLYLYRSANTTGVINVSLCNASGKLPTTVICQTTVKGSSLTTTNAWTYVNLATCPALDPTLKYAITLTWNSGTTKSVRTRYRASGSAPKSPVCKSTNNGSSWTATASGSVLFQAYGVATIPASPGSPATTTTTTLLSGLTLRATPTAKGSKTIDVYFPALNNPDTP